MLQRGDDARHAYLQNMFVVELPVQAVGPDGCEAFCLVSNDGKKNQVISACHCVDISLKFTHVALPMAEISAAEQRASLSRMTSTPALSNAMIPHAFRKSFTCCAVWPHRVRRDAAAQGSSHVRGGRDGSLAVLSRRVRQ